MLALKRNYTAFDENLFFKSYKYNNELYIIILNDTYKCIYAVEFIFFWFLFTGSIKHIVYFLMNNDVGTVTAGAWQ